MTSRSKIGGVDVCLDEDLLASAPHCIHGPTIVFERFYGVGGKSKKFYACSAYRDRKECSFFCWVDDAKRIAQKQAEPVEKSSVSQRNYAERREAARKFKGEILFCENCSLLLLPNEEDLHSNHKIIRDLKKTQLRNPMALLKPLSNNKTHAQFVFSDSTLKFLCQLILVHLSKKRILCIGTPRLYEVLCEEIKKKCLPDVTCLLMDLDDRLEQFYDNEELCVYNMFNHHFFQGEESKKTYLDFISDKSEEDLLIVVDPPFGARVEVIEWNLKKISNDWHGNKSKDKTILPTFWFFPYFMEPRIEELQANFLMLDYRVSYANHADFSDSCDDKDSSPVRIFTNLDRRLCVLPSDLGYRFCEKCARYVANINKHCKKCDSCTTKVGDTYKHCNECGRCVKSTWQHCSDCNRCELIGKHTNHDNKSTVCHSCGGVGHKRRDCPDQSQKRSHSEHKTSDSVSQKRYKGSMNNSSLRQNKKEKKNKKNKRDR